MTNCSNSTFMSSRKANDRPPPGANRSATAEALDEVAGERVGGPVVAVATVVRDVAGDELPARVRSSCRRRRTRCARGRAAGAPRGRGRRGARAPSPAASSRFSRMSVSSSSNRHSSRSTRPKWRWTCSAASRRPRTTGSVSSCVDVVLEEAVAHEALARLREEQGQAGRQPTRRRHRQAAHGAEPSESAEAARVVEHLDDAEIAADELRDDADLEALEADDADPRGGADADARRASRRRSAGPRHPRARPRGGDRGPRAARRAGTRPVPTRSSSKVGGSAATTFTRARPRPPLSGWLELRDQRAQAALTDRRASPARPVARRRRSSAGPRYVTSSR